MGWTREARAHTSPIFGEMEENLPSIRKAVMTASSRDISVATAIKRALLSNRFTSSTTYLNAAKQSYVHKLPKVTQTSPLRDASYFLGLAFPEGAPAVTATSCSVPSAMDQLDGIQSSIGTYDASVHSFTYAELGAYFTTAYSNAAYVDDTTFTYVETVLDSDNTIISTSTKTGYRTSGYNIKVLKYDYTYLGLPKVKLYIPAAVDSHLFHDIFNTYSNSDEFVAYPIYPLMLDSVYIDAASREEEYTDAKKLLNNLRFPIETVFNSIKAGVPTDVGSEENHITDVFLLNAININSPTQAGMAYLFEFFDAIYLNHLDPGTGAVNWSATNYSVKISESDYNFQLDFNGITNTVVSGNSTTYGSTIASGGTITLTAPSASGANTHRKLVVTGVSAHTIVDYPSGVTTSVAINVSTDTEHLDYANFCIPLIHGVVAQLPSLELKEQVFLESFVIVSHSLTEYYLKWYQEIWRSIKQFVVIAITILIILFVTDGGITASAFFASFATAVATNIVLEMLLPLIDNPYLKAAVAIVVSYVIGDLAGSEGFSFDEFALSDPMTLIGLTGAVGNAYIEQQMKDLQAEMGDFVTDSKELWEQLEEKRDMLEESDFSELMLSSLMINIRTYEEPTIFYTRTLIPNPGALVYDQLETYFDSKLTLPRLSPLGAS